MHDEVEPRCPQHVEIIHRALDDLEVDAPLAGHGAVEGEHGLRDIHHRHPRAGGGVERAVLPATGGEAEHLEAVEHRRNPRAFRRTTTAEPRARVVERAIGRGLGERRTRVGEPVPGPAVVGNRRGLERDGPIGVRQHAVGSATPQPPRPGATRGWPRPRARGPA